jgi:polyisoprenoid-binding protein YceI
MRSVSGAVLVLGLLVVRAADATVRVFDVESGREENLVRFDSRATLESFGGETHRVSGAIALDPVALGDSLHVAIEVDMASLDTGIDKRNRDMRENHLETEVYPTARFRGARVLVGAGSRMVPETPVDVEIEGAFTLHGVTRRIRVPVTLVLEDAGQAIRATSLFTVTLADYAIERPRFLFLKLAEEQAVSVEVVARAAVDGP